MNLIIWLWQHIYLCCHSLYHIHNINSNVRHHFLIMAMNLFCSYAIPYLIPNKLIPWGWLYSRTTFPYLFFLPLYLHWIWTILWLVQPRPYVQHLLPVLLKEFLLSMLIFRRIFCSEALWAYFLLTLSVHINIWWYINCGYYFRQ